MKDLTYKLKIVSSSGKIYHWHIGVKVRSEKKEFDTIFNTINFFLKQPTVYVYFEETIDNADGTKRKMKKFMLLSTSKIETVEVEGKVS